MPDDENEDDQKPPGWMPDGTPYRERFTLAYQSEFTGRAVYEPEGWRFYPPEKRLQAFAVLWYDGSLEVCTRRSLTMDFVFRDFHETIQRANDGGFLTDNSRLILSGKIEYADERGDLTPNQASDLYQMLGDVFDDRYRADREIVTFGHPESVFVKAA